MAFLKACSAMHTVGRPSRGRVNFLLTRLEYGLLLMTSHLDAALSRARKWLSNAKDRRVRFMPTAHMSAHEVSRMEEKLDTEIERARAAVSDLEAKAWMRCS